MLQALGNQEGVHHFTSNSKTTNFLNISAGTGTPFSLPQPHVVKLDRSIAGLNPKSDDHKTDGGGTKKTKTNKQDADCHTGKFQ